MKNFNPFLLLFIPLVQFIIGTIIFFYQGGYGGGHGTDYLFYIFQMPGIIMVELIINFQVSNFFWINDYFGIAIIPLIVNFILYSIFILIYKFIKKLISD